MSISPTQEIIDELRAGRMVILVDDEDRENEGDLMIAADFVTPEAINFMAKYARGLVCLTLNRERCDQLGLAPMARDNRSSYNTAFTTSIEAAEGVTTGHFGLRPCPHRTGCRGKKCKTARHRAARTYLSDHGKRRWCIDEGRPYRSRMRSDGIGRSDPGERHL